MTMTLLVVFSPLPIPPATVYQERIADNIYTYNIWGICHFSEEFRMRFPLTAIRKQRWKVLFPDDNDNARLQKILKAAWD